MAHSDSTSRRGRAGGRAEAEVDAEVVGHGPRHKCGPANGQQRLAFRKIDCDGTKLIASSQQAS